jgi:two-component system chemotaxis response regulator CheB
MSKKIRVVVVDDSALVRSLLAEIINRQRDMECIGTANDPLIARNDSGAQSRRHHAGC